MTTDTVPTPGFGSPVRGAQRVFRCVLQAMSRPTTTQHIPVELDTPRPLGPVAAAIVLTLCDAQSPLWLDRQLRSDPTVADWVRFHTAAPTVEDPGEAAFVVASGPDALPNLNTMSVGSDVDPQKSATVVVDVRGAEPAAFSLLASGPGIDGVISWEGHGMSADLLDQRTAGADFPRGVDLIFAGHDTVVALPRTTHLQLDQEPT